MSQDDGVRSARLPRGIVGGVIAGGCRASRVSQGMEGFGGDCLGAVERCCGAARVRGPMISLSTPPSACWTGPRRLFFSRLFTRPARLGGLQFQLSREITLLLPKAAHRAPGHQGIQASLVAESGRWSANPPLLLIESGPSAAQNGRVLPF